MKGSNIGHYRVVSLLGAGGMGEVYRAADSRLGRDVALKVLPTAFANDAERMARFQREAQVLASLNHPNIASIYGLEESGGVRALVMELVEGPTLSGRIAQGALPVEEALQIAKQIAEALESAHERGIIHRDLKPANVKVTPDGKVKVLDFGLAKALEGDPVAGDVSHSPTLTMGATKAGVILGTAAYMSPEQAKGKSVDRRADIWAFGCLLFEMLTGNQVFSGETVTDTLAAVVRAEPDWSLLPSSTPAAMRNLLHRCLERDAKQRLQAVGEARIAIEKALCGKAEEASATPGAAVGVARRDLRLWWMLAGGIVFGAVMMALAMVKFLPTREPPLLMFDVAVEKLQGWPAISPDGRKIVYRSGGRLWIRELDRLEARELPGTEMADLMFWSPDSTFVGYIKENKLWKFPVNGGQGTMIADAGGGFVGHAGASWAEDDRIVFSRGNTGLLEVSARGGDPRAVIEPDGKEEQDLHEPQILPGGKGVLFVAHRILKGADSLYVLMGTTRKLVLRLDGQLIESAGYSATGHIVYRRGGANPGVWAVPFSLSKLEVTGEPFLVAANAGGPRVSADGTLTYVSGVSGGLHQLVWVNRKGEIVGRVGQQQTAIFQPALSPDGSRVAVGALEGETDIWVHDVKRGTKSRLTFDVTLEQAPTWSPDGKRIFYFSPNGANVMSQAADGGGTPDVLAQGGSPSVSRDAKYLLFDRAGPQGDTQLWYLELSGDRKPVPFLQTQASTFQPRVSPDGKYAAYVSDESGQSQVYLKRFPSGEGKWQVSVTRGTWPRWNGRGDRLYYREGDAIMEVEVSARPSLTLSTPRKLFDSGTSRVFMDEPFRYDVTPDGQRFLMVQDMSRDTRAATITVVQNWYAEFKDKSKK